MLSNICGVIYEYDYKCNHYSLVMPAMGVKQLHVTS